jgi:hypothetical protein
MARRRCAENENRAAVPRMPAVEDLARLGNMGVFGDDPAEGELASRDSAEATRFATAVSANQSCCGTVPVTYRMHWSMKLLIDISRSLTN